jgi:hypothetical protein
MLITSVFILLGSVATLAFLLISLVFFLLDSSLMNFCYNFYEDAEDCAYDLLNLKLRLVVAALGIILALAICCVAIIQYVYIARRACCQSVVHDEHPTIVLKCM